MIYIILLSLIWFSVLYIIVSKRDQNYFSVLTIGFIGFIPANYLLPIVYDLYVEEVSLSLGYAYVYLTYFAVVTVFFIAFTFNYKLPQIRLSNPKKYYFSFNMKLASIILILLSFIIYLPILINFSEYLSAPRGIYTATRDGYGHYYFVSLLFLNLSLVLSFFSFRAKGIVVFFVVYFVLAYLHGSKAVILWGVLSYILFLVYYRGMQVRFGAFIILSFFISLFVFATFYLTGMNGDDISVLILKISSYSDYTRNAANLIDNYNMYFDSHFYGLLQLQDEFYSRIPRILYEEKPRAFGSLVLSQAIYPDWFYSNVGDASFGMVGVVFADFGYFAIFYLMLTALVKGILLRWCVDSFLESKNLFYFILMLFLAGLGLLSLGLGYLLPEHVFIAFFISILLTKKIKKA